ncbi:MAG: thioesterase domain-containing protein, partial [Pseudomonadota bacterium]
GPYVIGGYSVGAIIAFETARQLEALGKSVPRVIVFDMSAPGYPKPASLARRVGYHLRQILKRGPSGGLTYLRERVFAGADQINRIKHELEVLGVVTPEILERVSTGLLVGHSRYTPAAKITGRIELISAGQKLAWHEAVLLTADCGWSDYTTGGVEVHQLDAGHLDLFKGDRQKQLAQLVGTIVLAAAS